MEDKKINIPAIDLKFVKERQAKHNYVILTERFFIRAFAYNQIEYQWVDRYDSDADDAINETKRKGIPTIRQGYFKISRKNISQIGYYYNSEADVWWVSLEFTGIAESVDLYFDTKSLALDLFKIVDNYFYND